MNSGPPTPNSQTSARRRYKLATELVFIDNSDGTGVKDPYIAASVPIYQSATFKQTSATQMGEFDYSRSGNPTRSHLGESLGNCITDLLDICNRHQFILVPLY